MNINLNLIKKYVTKAKKSLWQNFLVDDKKVEEIANILDIKWKNIIEVWPWYWALTEKLLIQKPKNITLVELDENMIEALNKRVENKELNIEWINFEIINKDILVFEPSFEEYFVIANIPYYITSPILRRFLYEIEKKPEKMVILMQKDVWDKILSGQNNSKKIKSSVLSLFISKKCVAKEILLVPKESFRPIPKVESSVLLFEIHNNYKNIDDDLFLKFIKISFAEPRKKLINNLVKWWFDKEKTLEIFSKLWFNEAIRWDSLNVENFCELIESLEK